MQLVTRNQFCAVLVIYITATTQVGCIGVAANLVRAVRGDLVPAEYSGLEGKRVAVITQTDSGHFGDDVSARILSRQVRSVLRDEVENITLVHEEEIESWRDTKRDDQLDFVSIGRGVKADKVVAIELTDLKLRDGATLFRGQVGMVITVYDIPTSKREFRRNIEDYSYPNRGGQYASETTEKRFRGVFLAVLGDRIARHFHPYDHRKSVALDAALLHQ